MKTEILIATWSKDIQYLLYNLKSIGRFACGFSGTTLLVAEQEANIFEPIARDYTCSLATYNRVPEPSFWHLQMQAEKCHADIHCPDADFILHTDSDCVFTEPVTPEDYFVEARPIMLIEEFKRLPGNPWQGPTEKALGFKCPYETMRRHPQINTWSVYREMREHIERLHKVPFLHYVISQKPDFPWGFSEHATLGAYAYHSVIQHDKYRWVDVTGGKAHPHSKLAQFWSHSPIDQPQDLPSGGRGCPMETYRKLGLA